MFQNMARSKNLFFSRILCVSGAILLIGGAGCNSKGSGSAPSPVVISTTNTTGTATVTATLSSPSGNTAVGGNKTLTLTIANASTSTAAISDISLSGLSSLFTITSNGCSSVSVSANSSCAMAIRFSPTSVATTDIAATLSYTIGSGGSTGSITVLFSETSYGVASVSTYMTPDSSSTAVGSTKDVIISVTNSSSASLTASSLTIGSVSSPYSLYLTTCGSTLAVGATCAISFRFTPTSAGTHTASPAITYSVGDGTTASITISLSEVAYVPAANLSISVPSAGTTEYLSTRDVTLTVSNSSSATGAATGLNLGAMALTGAGSANYSVISTTCSGTLNINSSCQYIVRFTSPGDGTYSATATLTFDPGSGTGNATATGTLAEVGTPYTITVGAVYPTNGAKWNDYIQTSTSAFPVQSWDPTTIFSKSDTACNEASYPNYWQCLHAGELRTVTLTGTNSCSGLVFSDTLSAFNWTCAVVSGTARIRSFGLKEGKGLADLVDANGWKANQLTVTNGTRTIYQSSASTAWWTNAVDTTTFASDISSTSSTTLSSASKIYIVPNNITLSNRANIYITGAKVALVTLPGKTVTFYHTTSGGFSAYHVYNSSSAHYLWLEANLKDHVSAGQTSYMVWLNAAHARVHHSTITGNFSLSTSYYGIINSGAARITEIKLDNFVYDGVHSNGQPMVLSQIRSTNNRYRGVYFSSPYSTASRIMISNTGDPGWNNGVFSGVSGLEVGSGSYSTFAFISVINTTTSAFRNSAEGLYLSISQLLALNSGSTGLLLKGVVANAGQIALGHHYNHGVKQFRSTVAYQSNILLGNNGTADCGGEDAGHNVISNGLDSSCNNAGSSSGAVTQGRDFASTIEGKVTSDSQNTSDTNGLATVSTTTDVSSFDSMFRAWGIDTASSFANSDQRGKSLYISSLAQIWDYRINTADSVVYNYNGTFTANAACPASVDGTVTMTDQNGRVYLMNAYELSGYGGNNDGLCEANETCVYQPHFGAYAGEGTPTQTCTFSNGPTVTGVTMYVYPTLGI